MDIISVILIGVIAAFLVVIVKQYKPEYALVLSVISAILILTVIVSYLVPIISEVKDIMRDAAVDLKYISVLIKGVGICYITQFASDTCKDAGQISLSSKIELVGRVAVCLSSLPLYKDLLSLTQTIIGKIN